MSNFQLSHPNAAKTDKNDPPLRVYFVWLTNDKAIFVEKDCVKRSGRLMCSLAFSDDTLVGTKHDLSSTAIPDKWPTFVKKELIGYVEPESLSSLDDMCRTVCMLEGSPKWARLALKEIKLFRLFSVVEWFDLDS